jgi:hypothetical protein
VHLEVPCAFSRYAWAALHIVFRSFVLFCFGCGSRGPTRVPAWVGERFCLLGGGGVLRNIGFAILSMDCNVRHKETLQWDPLGWASDESSANPASPSSPARPGSPASQPIHPSSPYDEFHQFCHSGRPAHPFQIRPAPSAANPVQLRQPGNPVRDNPILSWDVFLHPLQGP